jgi:hypothetical protein
LYFSTALAIRRLPKHIITLSDRYKLDTVLPLDIPIIGKKIIGKSPVVPIVTAFNMTGEILQSQLNQVCLKYLRLATMLP